MKYHTDAQFYRAVEILCEQIRDLKAEINCLEAKNKRLQFIVDNGLGEEDMRCEI